MGRENLAFELDNTDSAYPLDVESINGDDIKHQVGKRVKNDDKEPMVERFCGRNNLCFS